MGLKAKKTRTYSPRTIGKAERFIKTLLDEWAYVIPFSTSATRHEVLPA
jgi:transposase InsO family protein